MKIRTGYSGILPAENLKFGRSQGLLKFMFTQVVIKQSGAWWWCTLRQVLADFAVCDGGHYCKALCGVKFSQIE